MALNMLRLDAKLGDIWEQHKAGTELQTRDRPL